MVFSEVHKKICGFSQCFTEDRCGEKVVLMYFKRGHPWTGALLYQRVLYAGSAKGLSQLQCLSMMML